MSIVVECIEVESGSESSPPNPKNVGRRNADKPSKTDNKVNQRGLTALPTRLFSICWPSIAWRSLSGVLLFMVALMILETRGLATTSVSPIPPENPNIRRVCISNIPSWVLAKLPIVGLRSRKIKHPAIKVLIALIAARSPRLSCLRRG